jgi:hypothetical protein
VVLMPELTWSPVQQRGSLSRFAIAGLVAVGVAIAYFLAARLSLALLAKSDGVAVFWPAAGIASGVLIAAGPQPGGRSSSVSFQLLLPPISLATAIFIAPCSLPLPMQARLFSSPV